MNEDPDFRPDLYRGTAADYDAYRAPYGGEMIDDLLERVAPSEDGRLLDLACGTGLVTFALAGRFAETWALDQEPDMVTFARAQAARRGVTTVRWIEGAAEDLEAPGGYFELVTAGNAFHRLRRALVAERIRAWLRPRGHVALLWTSQPWSGADPWQLELRALLEDWRDRAGTQDRTPEGWEQRRLDHPDSEVLAAAGFEPLGIFQFHVRRVWSVERLAGHALSTSSLSREALGGLVPPFCEDLARRLLALAPSDVFVEMGEDAYEIAMATSGTA